MRPPREPSSGSASLEQGPSTTLSQMLEAQSNPGWRTECAGLRPAGGGGENRTRVRSSVPQDIYERSPGFDLTLASPLGPDPPEPVAVRSPSGGRDARRKRVSGVYAGDRSC